MVEETPGTRGEVTKARIVQAAIETLRREGYAGSSARTIAAAGGFNQALIFYHFGSVRDVLIAALDRTSDERMEAYRIAAAEATDLGELTKVAGRIYREDLASGHVKVMVELIAGASSDPQLAPAIVARIEPWIAFAGEEVARIGAGSVLAGMVPSQDAAYAIVALFLGLEMLSHLEGDTARTQRLFELANALAAMASGLGLIGSAQGDPS
ncbi:MAG: TetR/AcrR family transcriptional regulator [Actinobacteria bacterium]|nr:TetR/AcrR family transcriptional regulator [Actinomycetota bacterium]